MVTKNLSIIRTTDEIKVNTTSVHMERIHVTAASNNCCKFVNSLSVELSCTVTLNVLTEPNETQLQTIK
jgi:hypothetical protein